MRTCAVACPRVLTVDDSDGTPLVVFPKLSDSDRKRGATYEAARRSTLENALRAEARDVARVTTRVETDAEVLGTTPRDETVSAA